jgi:hypothetical protein
VLARFADLRSVDGEDASFAAARYRHFRQSPSFILSVADLVVVPLEAPTHAIAMLEQFAAEGGPRCQLASALLSRDRPFDKALLRRQPKVKGSYRFKPWRPACRLCR